MARGFQFQTEAKWNDLGLAEKLNKALQAKWDPVFFFEDSDYLGTSFPKGLWPMQKEIIRRFELGIPTAWDVNEWMKARQHAFDHEKLDDWMLDNFQYYTELVMAAGMRSSKTTITGGLGLYGAFLLLNLPNPGEYFGLRKGQELFIINVATSDEQAHDTIYAVEAGLMRYSPYFESLKMGSKYNEFRFPDKDLVIRSGGSNSGSLVGRTLFRALFDELDRFQDTGGRRSGFEVYNGLGRGVTSCRWPDSDPEDPLGQAGKKIAISSMMAREGMIDQLVNMSKKLDTMLGYKLATWEINPNLTEAALAEEFAKDPDKAWRDFGVQPGMNIQGYYRDPTVIKWNMERQNPLLQYQYGDEKHLVFQDSFQGKPGIDYALAGDPAVKNDSFGMCLGHKEPDGDKYKFVVDFVHRIRPALEVDPAEVAWLVDQIKRRFNVRWFIIDQWNYPETIAKVRASGIDVEFNTVRKEQHDKLKECWYTKKCDCYEFPFLKKELTNLEIHRSTKVDHPRDGSKDVADAVANACWKVMTIEDLSRPPAHHYVKVVQRRTPLARPYSVR